ncbi:MAG: primosomal protein N' [Gammaproteobacteria bacterium]|nr:primosomal protein N' [Gammaproteobacteria bacterium]MBQ0839829.1 primosomal protein N' [Gammaproteobacteria bacterium]
MTETLFYQVAVQSPLRRLFDYLPPSGFGPTLPVGVRVTVPFGKRAVTGIVVSSTSSSDYPADKLKSISAILDTAPLLPPVLFEVLLWAARYYQHPLGEVLASALPTLLRKGGDLPQQSFWRLSTHGKGLPADALRRAPSQQALLQLLQVHDQLSREAIDAAGISTATIRSLKNKALIENFSSTVSGQGFDANGELDLLGEAPLSLSPDQQAALGHIEFHTYNSYLIDGETGSGKTEVYLQAIANVLRHGRQALVLIPEINLSPQTLARFRARFNCPIALIHSGLSERQRLEAWWAAANGSAGIVIGTRSAAFVPLQSPGIIIVDEEHDSSFKQQEGFRYSARDVAVMRANRENIPLLLGSATPSLESLYNCTQQRYHHLSIKGRHGGAVQAQWQLVDICHSQLNTGFSQSAINAIETQLAEGNQILVFLNRRGFAPTLMCHDCGWVANCKHCDAHLTVHTHKPGLHCHHCESRHALPQACPDCASQQLNYLGQGTERSEATLQALFPAAKVHRVDRDTTGNKRAMEGLLEEINTNEPCILVGTQMLAKGHHFPGVTLVVVLDADTSLFSADFRALEKMGQLITQVAGRAGRGEKPGVVMIQSHHCEHPVFELLSQHSYGKFAQHLLRERQFSAMPPFTNAALIRAEFHQGGEALGLLHKARDYLESQVPSSPALRYLGPFPAAMEKRGGRYRYQLTLIGVERRALHQLLGALSHWFEQQKEARKVRWSIDVDPQDSI